MNSRYELLSAPVRLDQIKYGILFQVDNSDYIKTMMGPTLHPGDHRTMYGTKLNNGALTEFDSHQEVHVYVERKEIPPGSPEAVFKSQLQINMQALINDFNASIHNKST